MRARDAVPTAGANSFARAAKRVIAMPRPHHLTGPLNGLCFWRPMEWTAPDTTEAMEALLNVLEHRSSGTLSGRFYGLASSQPRWPVRFAPIGRERHVTGCILCATGLTSRAPRQVSATVDAVMPKLTSNGEHFLSAKER